MSVQATVVAPEIEPAALVACDDTHPLLTCSWSSGMAIRNGRRTFAVPPDGADTVSVYVSRIVAMAIAPNDIVSLVDCEVDVASKIYGSDPPDVVR